MAICAKIDGTPLYRISKETDFGAHKPNKFLSKKEDRIEVLTFAPLSKNYVAKYNLNLFFKNDPIHNNDHQIVFSFIF